MNAVYHPGHICPQSGLYARVDEYGNDLLDEGGDAITTVVTAGEPFPPLVHGKGYRPYDLARHMRRNDEE